MTNASDKKDSVPNTYSYQPKEDRGHQPPNKPSDPPKPQPENKEKK